MLSRIECPGSGHLDELAVSCQMQALEQEKDAEALARTVKEAYDNLPPEMITKVFDHLPIVWELILVSNGDNISVEERRGHHNIAAALEG